MRPSIAAMEILVYEVEGRAQLSPNEQVYDLTISVEDFTALFAPPDYLDANLLEDAGRRLFQGPVQMALLMTRRPVFEWRGSARNGLEGVLSFRAQGFGSEDYLFLSGGYQAGALHARLGELEEACARRGGESARRRLQYFLRRRVRLLVRVLVAEDLLPWREMVSWSPDVALLRRLVGPDLVLSDSPSR